MRSSRTADQVLFRRFLTAVGVFVFALVETFIIVRLRSDILLLIVLIVSSAFILHSLVVSATFMEESEVRKTEREVLLAREERAKAELSALRVRLNDGVSIKIIHPYEGSLHPLGIPDYRGTSIYWLPKPEQIIYVLEINGVEVDRNYALLKPGQEATVFVSNDNDAPKIIIHLEDLEIGPNLRRINREMEKAKV